MNQVFVCGTYFHLYVSILRLIYSTEKSSKSLLVVNDHTPGMNEILPALRSSGFFDDVVQVPFVALDKRMRKENNWLKRLLKVKYVEANSDILRVAEFIRRSEINLFYNLGLTSAYFLLKYPSNFIRMLEDGERNYLPRVSRFTAFKRRYVLRTVMGDGLDPEVKEIHVQDINRLNERVRHKGRTLPLAQMQDNLKPAEYAKILGLFLNNQTIQLHGTRRLLLITQPFSEERYFDESSKIRLYEKVLSPYVGRYEIFIKPHPRELTRYADAFKYKVTEIPRAFPLEMFNLLKNIDFDLGVTLYSSGLKNMANVKQKIFLGKAYLKEL
jgi:hypothetical protein